MDLAQRYVEAVQGLTSDELDLLTVLALAEPLIITHFLRPASAAGIRRETRAHDTQSLRLLLDDWGRRGLVHSDERTFTCARDLRWQLLRAAAARGRLNELTTTLSQSLYGAAPNGQVQLVARSEHNRFNVGVSPPEFSGELQLVEEVGHLLVYATAAEALPVLKWIGSGLSFPLPAQARVMEVLSRLAHLLPVQSFELTSARSVPADPKPWLRIVPHLDGLSITLSVRISPECLSGKVKRKVMPTPGFDRVSPRARRSVQTEAGAKAIGEKRRHESLVGVCPQIELDGSLVHAVPIDPAAVVRHLDPEATAFQARKELLLLEPGALQWPHTKSRTRLLGCVSTRVRDTLNAANSRHRRLSNDATQMHFAIQVTVAAGCPLRSGVLRRWLTDPPLDDRNREHWTSQDVPTVPWRTGGFNDNVQVYDVRGGTPSRAVVDFEVPDTFIQRRDNQLVIDEVTKKVTHVGGPGFKDNQCVCSMSGF